MVNLKKIFKKDFLLISLVGGLFTLLYLIGVLLRHFRLESFGYDLGIFSQEVYLLSKFKLPFSTIKIPNMIIWGDHWTPSMVIFVPLVWIFKRTELVLLISQVVFLIFAGLIIWFISKIKTSDKFFSLILFLVFLIFYGIQNAIFFDVHPFFFASMLIPLMYFFFLKEKWTLFFAFSFLIANLKEDIPLYLIAFGIYLLIKKKYKQGLALIIFYSFWFCLIIKVFIPYFSFTKNFLYSPQISNFKEIFWRLIFPLEKIKVVAFSFWHYSFLPILSPFSILLSGVNFGESFLGEGSLAGRWGFDRHYKAILGPVLALGAIEGYCFLRNFLKRKIFGWLKIILLANMIVASFFLQYFLHLQLNMLSKKEYWQITNHKRKILSLIKDLGKNQKSVATQNNLVSHLSNRTEIYLLSYKFGNECYFNSVEADYILVDLFPGQSPVNFLGCSLEELENWLRETIKKGNYKVLYQEDGIYLLGKNF